MLQYNRTTGGLIIEDTEYRKGWYCLCTELFILVKRFDASSVIKENYQSFGTFNRLFVYQTMYLIQL